MDIVIFRGGPNYFDKALRIIRVAAVTVRRYSIPSADRSHTPHPIGGANLLHQLPETLLFLPQRP